MEEALDLRIHNRRSSVENVYKTYYSSDQLRFVLNSYEKTRVEDIPADGDLVIVEADTDVNASNHSLSPSPETRSSDTDTEKGSPHHRLTPHGDIMEIELSSSSFSDDAQKKTISNSGRPTKYSSKSSPPVDRMLKPSRLMCFLCDQKAKNGKTLETHIQKSHCIQTTQGRLLCCTECGFKCEIVDQLKSHYEESHTGTKSGGDTKIKPYYPCSHCSRMYRKQSLLDAHMRLVNQKDMWKKNNVSVKT